MQPLKTLALALFLIISTGAFAQKELIVTEGSATTSLGERTGFTITIDKKSEKETLKALKTWLGEMQKKPDFEETVKHEFKLTGFVNASISPDPINVYFLFTEYSDYVKVTGFLK